MKFVFPLYVAVIGCVPTESDAVLSVATPFASSALVPSEAPLSKNVTLPVAVPNVAVTVAVNVTDCPKTDGFGSEASVVPGSAGVTA